MCRWFAYRGGPIPLSLLVLESNHSLMDQSLNAKLRAQPEFAYPPGFTGPNLAANGDGFGLAWLSDTGQIARLRETVPAWNSQNLRTITPHVTSPFFMGHLRAAPGADQSVENCQPFLYGDWLFQHNGGIGGFSRLRAALLAEIAPEFQPLLRGTTDSEFLFYLALSSGLEDDPVQGLLGMVEKVAAAKRAAHVDLPWAGAICVSRGENLYGMRYSSKAGPGFPNIGASPTLFYTEGKVVLEDLEGDHTPLPPGARVLASEPLVWPYDGSTWKELPDYTIGVFPKGAGSPELISIPT